MKQYLIIILACILPFAAWSQSNYWQQEVNIQITAHLNETKKTIHAVETIEYINHSPDTLKQLYFHIWPNAYRNQNTALFKQLKKEASFKNLMGDSEPGWIDSLAFTQDGIQIKTIQQANIDIILLELATPLAPGSRTQLATPFVVQLPPYFSRSGYTKDQIIACQWYPKPAVYDAKGWHAFPYLDQGEFYSEFGSFDVKLDVPANYIVGATGRLQSKEELERYRTIGAANYALRDSLQFQPYLVSGERKTLHYKADSVHDFAWFASPNFIIEYDTVLIDQLTIDVFVFKRSKSDLAWNHALDFAKSALKYYSKSLGTYPYPVAQVVEGPSNNSSGGMEYPMITLITSPESTIPFLDGVITHEVGHNWFYGILATNERNHAWMDEGINSFFQFRYEAEKYRSNGIFGEVVPADLKLLEPEVFLKRIYIALNQLPAKEPIETSSENFSNKDSYGTVIYVKTAIWCYLVEQSIGKAQLEQAMKTYFNRWKFKHPYPEDFKAVLEEVTGKNMDELFKSLKTKGNFR